jgi:hypothetical protein
VTEQAVAWKFKVTEKDRARDTDRKMQALDHVWNLHQKDGFSSCDELLSLCGGVKEELREEGMLNPSTYVQAYL